MENLNNVTLVCIDCKNHESAKKAIEKSIEQINFGEVLFCTDKNITSEKFKTIEIEAITSKEQYSEIVLLELPLHIKTDYVLIIQYDGYIINPELWDNDWLKYDYIGAPWWYHDDHNVGNGGFSLRSKKLMRVVKNLIDFRRIEKIHPEDNFICRIIQNILISEYNIKFAPEYIASVFSYEPNPKYKKFKKNTFGFHGIPALIL